MTHAQLERRVTLLTRYAVGLTLVVAVVLFSAASPWWSGRGDEDSRPDRSVSPDTLRATVLVAEQIRVVEPDGSLALLAGNSERMPGVILEGDTMTTRGGAAGLIFFYEGEEVGGLTYRIDEDRDPPYALGHLSLDQYRSDQAIYMQYDGGGGARQRAGLYVKDYPTDFDAYDYKAFLNSTAGLPAADRDAARRALQARFERGELGGQRVAVESNRRVASLRLSDYGGRERLRAVVDSAGTARIEFLDGAGNVLRSITARD